MCAWKEAIGAMIEKSQMAAEGLGTGQRIFFCTPGSDKKECNLVERFFIGIICIGVANLIFDDFFGIRVKIII